MFNWRRGNEDEEAAGSVMDVISPMEFFENEPAKKQRKSPLDMLEEDTENTDMIDQLAEKLNRTADLKEKSDFERATEKLEELTKEPSREPVPVKPDESAPVPKPKSEQPPLKEKEKTKDKPAKTSAKGFLKKTKDEGMLDVEDLPWMDEEEQTAETDEDIEQAERIQRKIMAYFVGGKNAKSLSAKDAAVSAMEEADFYKSLANGEITDSDEDLLLLQVRDPLHTAGVGAEQMFEEISGDPRKKQILALATGYNARNWQQVNERALRDFLAVPMSSDDADHRTPLGFASVKMHFLRGIKPRASEAAYQAYEESMEELERILYGQRYDFYLQFEKLKQRAFESVDSANNFSGKKTVSTSKPAKIETPAMQPAAEKPRIKTKPPVTAPNLRSNKLSQSLVVLNTERSESILNRVVIDGGAWIENGKERYLNSFNLAEAGLAPAYEANIDGTKVYLSTVFQLPGGRVVAIGYVPTARGVKARSYHRNNSEGLWYYLPDYVRGPEGTNKIGWYGEGYGAESLILPIKLQEVLSEAEKYDGIKTITNENPFFLFAGTAHGYNSRQEYNDRLATGRLKGDYYQEVSTRPSDHDFETVGVHKTAPQMLSISIDKAPDFRQKIASFTTTSILTGKVFAEGFESHGGRYDWLFCKDTKGRVWIGNVEATAPVTSTGLRREWVLAGDFTTSLYEYSRQSDGYGDPRDTRGPYQCMWKNYLSKIPMIKKFLQL